MGTDCLFLSRFDAVRCDVDEQVCGSLDSTFLFSFYPAHLMTIDNIDGSNHNGM